MLVSWLDRMLNKRTSTAARALRRRPRGRLRPKSHLSVLQLESRLTPAVTVTDPLQNINHFVVIYQENWSFDSLYGFFPGANGIANATDANGHLLPQYQQVDKNGNPITTVPQPLGPDGNPDPRFPATLPADPYNVVPFIKTSVPPGAPAGLTGDIVHRFYHEQLQIDNGALQPSTTNHQNKLVTWSDNPGLVLSYIDSTNLPEGQLAQQYSLDDNFFHAAYGGSFLNHQFLVAATAPQWNQPIPAGFASSFDPATQTLHDNHLTIDGKFVVNTTFGAQTPHPSGIPANQLLAPINDNHPFLSDGVTPDPTYTPTIGDRLDDQGVSWKWYSGGWTNALEGHPDTAPFGGGFQFHHQPFAYYKNFAPLNPDGTQNPETSSLLNPNAHLQDETQFFVDLSSGNLPAVSFIKPLGPNNEHPGYASELQGQEHVADIVHAIQNSADWAHTAVIITYDEFGGRWDHVSPPQNNGPWGDGSRVPAIVISPYAKKGFVDHTEHDTLSILKTVEERFHLTSLNQFDQNASDLSSNFQLKAQASIGSAYAQVDAAHPGKFALIIQGTEGNDNIHVSLDAGNFHVTIDGPKVQYDHFFAQPISRLEIYGQGGNDKITVDSDVTVPAFIFGGNGRKVIQAGGGATVVVGGNGHDKLIGGTAADILIAGSKQSKLVAGSGQDILIGGTTNFDSNLPALQALEAEWSRTDETFAQKVAHLSGGATGGLNGPYILDSTTVQSHHRGDTLKGGSALDWFFAHVFSSGAGTLSGMQLGDMITPI
jgi:phospholipase C